MIHPVVIILSVAVVIALWPQYPMSFGHIVLSVIIILSVVVVMVVQSQSPTGCSVRSQAFLLSVHLEVKSFADGHIVHPIVIVLSIVTVLRCQSPMGRSFQSRAFLLSVHLKVKSFTDGHIVHLVVVLSLSDATAGGQGFLQLLPIFVDHILFPTITNARYV